MHSIRLPSRKYLFLCREYEFLFHYTLVDIFLIWVNIISDYGIYFLISISVINMVRHFYGFIGSFFFFLRGLYSRIAPIFLKIGDVCLAFPLSIFSFPLSILTLSARGLPCLQESMARRRIYGLRGGNTFCASLSPFHERLFHDDTNTESFLCLLPFQALATIPQISTDKWAVHFSKNALSPQILIHGKRLWV